MKRRKVRRELVAIATDRITALAREIGADSGYQRGWIVDASKELGIPYAMLQAILTGKARAGIRTVEKVCRKIGCPVGVLLEEG